MARDHKVERYLTEMGIEYEYRESVPVKSIHRDPQHSQYQARVLTSPLNQDTVDLYAHAIAQGADFPAPVLAKRDDGTYDLLGGFHRVNAKVRASITKTDAYVCTVTRVMADRIARSLNTLEAVQGASKAERVAQAKRLMDLHGFSVGAAARESGIGESLLTQEIRAITAQQRLARSEVDVSALSTAHLAEMQGVQNDRVLAALAAVVVRGRIAAAPIRPIIGEIRAARTEEEQLGVVRSFADTPFVRERVSLVATGRVRNFGSQRRSMHLFRAVNTANNLLTRYPSPPLLGITESELTQLRRDWNLLVGKMEALFGSAAFARPDDAPRVPEPTAAVAR